MNATAKLLRSPKLLISIGALCLLIVTGLGFALKNSLITAEDTDVLNDFLARRSDTVTSVLTFISTIFDPAGTILLSLLVSAVLWFTTRHWRYAALVCGSVAASAAITYTFKSIFHRSRPPLVDHLVNETDFSFPSGHVTGTTALLVSTAIVLTLLTARRSTRVLTWIISAAIIAAVAGSRLYLGVHWFSDTAAGSLVGFGTTLILSALLLGKKKEI